MVRDFRAVKAAQTGGRLIFVKFPKDSGLDMDRRLSSISVLAAELHGLEKNGEKGSAWFEYYETRR